ncbi:MAG: ABC transporter ATP-binding protein [Anaerolineae bacterium]
MSALVSVSNLTKTYHTGSVPFTALKAVSLELNAGEFVAVMGPSGSGKSTLLHLIAGLDRPNAGSVRVGRHTLGAMNETALAKFRRTEIGVIFQFFNLIDNLTAQANIELPALLAGQAGKTTIRSRAAALLDQLGIAGQGAKYPWELSGGQQQRVAIARALINQPALLLADEPTGNLDSASGHDVLRILRRFNRQGQTILMVTHDALAAAQTDRALFIHDGRLVGSMPGGDAGRIAQQLADLK